MRIHNAYEVVAFDEAWRSLGLNRHCLGLDRFFQQSNSGLSDFRVAHFQADHHHRSDIELFSWLWTHKFAGIVVDGNLTLDANLEDDSFGKASAFLLVRGDLRAKTITLAGADVVVLGDVVADGPVFNTYKHGCFEVAGSLRASHLVTDEHMTLVHGEVPSRAWALGYVDASMINKLRQCGSYAEILTTEAAAEFLDGNGGFDDPVGNRAILAALRAGRKVLRD